MKFSTITFMVAAALGAVAVGCGDASPAVLVACQQTVTLKPGITPTAGYGLVVQAVSYTDPATAGGPQPLSLSNARIISPFPGAVDLCAGSCLGGAGTFGSDIKVQTDVSGVLEYTVRVSQVIDSVDLVAVFGSQSPDTCKVTVQGG